MRLLAMLLNPRPALKWVFRLLVVDTQRQDCRDEEPIGGIQFLYIPGVDTNHGRG
jgi:hypothetical protein